MKKVLAIALVLCLVLGSAFAAKSAVKVGAQLGYGGFSMKFTDKEDSKNYIKISDGGFYFAGTAEFEFSDGLAAKAEVGMILMGKSKGSIHAGGLSYNWEADENMPAQFSLYAGAQYAIELSKEFFLNLGAGFDVLMGKLDKDTEDTFNAAMGLGLEAVGAYNINKNMAVTFGGKFAWHFINTNKDLDDFVKDIGDTTKTTSTGFQFFAGVTYAF